MGAIFSIIREFIYYWFHTNADQVRPASTDTNTGISTPIHRQYISNSDRSKDLDDELFERNKEALPIFHRYRPKDSNKAFNFDIARMSQSQNLFKCLDENGLDVENFKRGMDRLAASIVLILSNADISGTSDHTDDHGMSLKEITKQLSEHDDVVNAFPRIVARLISSEIFANHI